MTTVDAAGEDWISRTARRIVELDADIEPAEALRIASEMHQVERLAAMSSEAAVDFVQQQLTADRPDRYERRSRAR